MVLIKVHKSLFHMASFFGILLASPASCDAFTIVKHFFFSCYFVSTNIKGDEPFLDGSQTVLHVESLGHALHVFINGKLAGDEKLLSNENVIYLDYHRIMILSVFPYCFPFCHFSWRSFVFCAIS